MLYMKTINRQQIKPPYILPQAGGKGHWRFLPRGADCLAGRSCCMSKKREVNTPTHTEYSSESCSNARRH